MWDTGSLSQLLCLAVNLRNQLQTELKQAGILGSNKTSLVDTQISILCDFHVSYIKK